MAANPRDRRDAQARPRRPRAPSSDTQTFGSWLAAHGQSKKAIERLFDVFTVATLNAPSAQVSLTLGAMVFQDGLLRKADACDIGVSRVPLGQLHGDAAAAVLAAYDARYQAAYSCSRGSPRSTAIGGGSIPMTRASRPTPSCWLCPIDVAADLLPAGAIADPAAVRGLDVSPIINVHVIFDRVVLTDRSSQPSARPLSSCSTAPRHPGLSKAGNTSQCPSLRPTPGSTQPVAQLREHSCPELLRVLPAARDAVVRDFFVTREREATFRPVPGSAARRLPTTTNAPGLVVAGAWTATGWPATMESAVRSGVAAARIAGMARRSHPNRSSSANRSRRARGLGVTSTSITAAADSDSPALAALAAARELLDGPMREAVRRLEPSVRNVAAYHFGWVDADGAAGDAHRGKAIRGTLAVLSAEAVGAPASDGIPGALAVEFVHNFSLLHDDVMDGDTERRHRSTAWTVFGSSAAILAGDALLALAFETLLNVDPVRAQPAQRSLAAATQHLIVGQVGDLEFERRLDVTLDECLEMAAGKTASLLSCSASIGAYLAAAPPTVVQALEVFGYELGLAFQLVDDLLGIWGASASTGKPVGADLRARKNSLPVVAAMNSGDGGRRGIA